MAKTLALYEINDLLRQAIDARLQQAEENEGVYTDDWDGFIDGIAVERTQKILDCARYLKGLEAEADAVKIEAQKLRARQATLERHADRLRAYIEHCMTKGEVLVDANTKCTWRKSTTVEVTDMTALPDEFIKVEKSPMKSEIKKYLATGAPLLGAHLKEHLNLSIK